MVGPNLSYNVHINEVDFSLRSSRNLRLGPSASVAGDDRNERLMGALATLQELVTDPEIRKQLPAFLQDTFSKDIEKELDADRVKKEVAVKAELPETPTLAATAKAKAAAATKPEAEPNGPEKDEDTCNSSTHRNEHARLTRRMATLDEAKYPEIAKLWQGNRKERYMNKNVTTFSEWHWFVLKET